MEEVQNMALGEKIVKNELKYYKTLDGEAAATLQNEQMKKCSEDGSCNGCGREQQQKTRNFMVQTCHNLVAPSKACQEDIREEDEPESNQLDHSSPLCSNLGKKDT